MHETVQRAGMIVPWGQPRMLHDDPNAGPSLRGTGLTRTFGAGDAQTTALADVSVEFNPGQIVLLMGPSGSGKSTLLAVLSGLLSPHSGSVHVLGKRSLDHVREASMKALPGWSTLGSSSRVTTFSLP